LFLLPPLSSPTTTHASPVAILKVLREADSSGRAGSPPQAQPPRSGQGFARRVVRYLKMRRALALGLALAAVACAGTAYATQPAPAATPAPKRPDPDEIALTLFLIGDAGKPAPGGEPVLISLRRDLEGAGARAIVVFLGDNIYPAGLPAPGRPNRAEMERRLDAQLDAVRDTEARVLFIPGNHDWERGGGEGREAVKRQEERVEARGGPAFTYAPTGGCPGPEPIDVSDRLRLVALDTTWLLLAGMRAPSWASDCATSTQAAVLEALRAAVAGAGGRDVVIVAHHPLVSGGPHGGHFNWRQHLFPLTEVKEGLWLPLPIVGSIYPLARESGVSIQDQTSLEYRKMRDALWGALAAHPPLAWAAGHEHAQQVIESERYGRVLVSGAGIYGHEGHVDAVPGSLYQAARAGYQRIDFLRDGTRRLGVVEVAKDGSSHEAFAKVIDPVGPPR
jgi:hypothetical protein